MSDPTPIPKPRRRRLRRILWIALLILVVLPALIVLAIVASLRAAGVRQAILGRISSLAAENGAVREALDALDEASRENLQFIRASAITAQSDQAALESQAAEAVAENNDAEQRALVVAVTNASIQLAYGALAAPLTGDAVPRQPGLETFA